MVVEGQAGVALFVDSGAGQGAVAVGELEGGFGGVFGYDEGAGGEHGLAAEEAEGLGVGFFVVVGGVEEDEVDRLRETLEQRHHAAVFEGVATGDFEVLQVGAEGFEGRTAVLGEVDVSGSAADGFEAHGSGAGEEVYETAAGDARREDIEQGFAEAVAGGAGVGAGGRCQEAGTVLAGDDTHKGN